MHPASMSLVNKRLALAPLLPILGAEEQRRNLAVSECRPQPCRFVRTCPRTDRVRANFELFGAAFAVTALLLIICGRMVKAINTGYPRRFESCRLRYPFPHIHSS